MTLKQHNTIHNTNLPNNIDACWFVMYAFRVCFSECFSLAKWFSFNSVSAVPSFRQRVTDGRGLGSSLWAASLVTSPPSGLHCRASVANVVSAVTLCFKRFYCSKSEFLFRWAFFRLVFMVTLYSGNLEIIYSSCSISLKLYQRCKVYFN